MKSLQGRMLMVFLIMMIVSPVLYAQAPDTLWTRHIGTNCAELGWDVLVNKHGYLAFGYKTYYPGDLSTDFYLVQTNVNGDTIWTRTCARPGDEFSYAMTSAGPDGYLLAGTASSPGEYMIHIYFVKVDENGDTLWTRILPTDNWDEPHDIIPTGDGGFIIACHTYLSPDSSQQGLLLKIDSRGNPQWRRRFGGEGADQFWDVKQTSDGGYIVTGWSEPGYRDAYLVKTATDGAFIWGKHYGGGSSDEGLAVLQTADGGYLVSGRTYSFGNGNWDAYFIKTNSVGDTLWTRTCGGGAWDYAEDMVQSPDGGFITVGGTASDGTMNMDIYFIKIDPDGVICWTLAVGRPDLDDGMAIKKTPLNEYIAVGRTYYGDDDFYLIKLAPDTEGILDTLGQSLPSDFALMPNFPNPFNASTTIGYRLGKSGPDKLCIYDINGRYISTLIDKIEQAGNHFIIWDASPLPSGLYFARLETGERQQNIKMVLLK